MKATLADLPMNTDYMKLPSSAHTKKKGGQKSSIDERQGSASGTNRKMPVKRHNSTNNAT